MSELVVTCGDNKATLFVDRLHGRMPCISFNGKLMTPNQFQAVSGMEHAKNWMKSIKHCGVSLRALTSQSKSQNGGSENVSRRLIDATILNNDHIGEVEYMEPSMLEKGSECDYLDDQRQINVDESEKVAEVESEGKQGEECEYEQFLEFQKYLHQSLNNNDQNQIDLEKQVKMKSTSALNKKTSFLKKKLQKIPTEKSLEWSKL